MEVWSITLQGKRPDGEDGPRHTYRLHGSYDIVLQRTVQSYQDEYSGGRRFLNFVADISIKSAS